MWAHLPLIGMGFKKKTKFLELKKVVGVNITLYLTVYLWQSRGVIKIYRKMKETLSAFILLVVTELVEHQNVSPQVTGQGSVAPEYIRPSICSRFGTLHRAQNVFL